jgi:predicted RNase H-like HicB family nuclease
LIIYWSKDDDSSIVEVRELPGCMADGQTYNELRGEAEDIQENEMKSSAHLPIQRFNDSTYHAATAIIRRRGFFGYKKR